MHWLIGFFAIFTILAQSVPRRGYREVKDAGHTTLHREIAQMRSCKRPRISLGAFEGEPPGVVVVKTVERRRSVRLMFNLSQLDR